MNLRRDGTRVRSELHTIRRRRVSRNPVEREAARVLFLVTTTIIVVVFLCGVKVGRGARAAQAETPDQMVAAATPGAQPVPDTGPPAAEPPAPAAETPDELSYHERLKGAAAREETLKPKAETRPESSPEPAQSLHPQPPLRRRQRAAESVGVPTAGGQPGAVRSCPRDIAKWRLPSSSGWLEGVTPHSSSPRQQAPGLVLKVQSAGTPIAARPNRCRCASRRKNSSSPGLRAAVLSRRVARTQLPKFGHPACAWLALPADMVRAVVG